MKVAQQRELITIESTQRQQYVEFTHAWDKYMNDYENTALELIDQLKEKQGKEMTYTIAIVDDRLLDLTRFKTPNAWDKFYSRQDLGVSAGGTRFLDGRIGEVRIYPRALTAAQVFQNYNASRYKYTTTRASTSPKITTNPIVMNSNLLLNYDFGNDFCIEKSSNVSTSNYQFILDNATTNGAAFGDGSVFVLVG